MTDLVRANDSDPLETSEWLDALNDVIETAGMERAEFLLNCVIAQARVAGAQIPAALNTPYLNTIDYTEEEEKPEDHGYGRRIGVLIRWNAVLMVLKAGKHDSSLGGHLATYGSSALLYEIGFNYFFHAPDERHGGDLLFIQGHASPGIYARAFLEGRLSEKQLDHFRQEVDGEGIASYPHPWLMPKFWQFATVSMGLGPLQAIYQARFLKYLHNRELVNAEKRKVWAFCGDGEMDEPESLGALSIAARENLDNLIFVVNCNLQRLDGPVRGNGKIIQELERVFRGAGWNVIKVIWGDNWQPLLDKDPNGLLRKRMEEVVDGDYQTYKARDGAFVREKFFGAYPELKDLVADMTDDEIWQLRRGGHDPQKVFAAYAAAVKHQGQPTVILTKTVKGYGLGAAGEGQNITHQQKKMTLEQLKDFRDRFNIPVSDEEVENLTFHKPKEDSPEMQWLHERRQALGGYLPSRHENKEPLQIPELNLFEALLSDSGDRDFSTTMAFVRIINLLLRDKELGKRIVPIVPDESRTFGMEGMFRQYGIYSPHGQLYMPEDSGQIMYYREDVKGQILEEGINEAGAFCSWIAAATAYSNHNYAMIPFYIYYSMFGFQRVGDLAWAAGDMQARGFLLGGTSGRTTINGEGLQHQDGHSHILCGTIPNCISYDPTFSYELAVIIHDGLRRMYQLHDNVYYYITVMNENYHHPAMPKGVEDGIIKGMYLLQKCATKAKHKVQLLGSGSILNEVLAAAEILIADYKVAADVWSVTSFNELRKDALEVERWNRYNPEKKQRVTYVQECLEKTQGPIVASTDYMKIYADQIRDNVPRTYKVLGTDGFGRSDTRQALRRFFENDRYYIVYTALAALAEDGEITQKELLQARKQLNIDPDKLNPVLV